MKSLIITLSIFGCLVLGAITIGTYLVSVYNEQAQIVNRYEMKVKDNSSEFDNMFKKIAQVAQVGDMYKNGLKEVLSAYVNGRKTDSDKLLMNWIKEAVPTYDSVVYRNIQNIVVASRDGWTMRQKELVAIAEVANANIVIFPRNVILGFFGFKKIDPKVITSTRTEKAFETGKDDDFSLVPTK